MKSCKNCKFYVPATVDKYGSVKTFGCKKHKKIYRLIDIFRLALMCEYYI